LPLASGLNTVANRSRFGINQFGQLHVFFDILKSNSYFSYTDVIATLPEGARPEEYQYRAVFLHDPGDNGRTVLAGISTTGIISLTSGFAADTYNRITGDFWLDI